MNKNIKNSFKSQTILVASANSALASSGTVLIPSSGNGYNIANGQLAVINKTPDAHVALNTFLTATNDVAGTGPNTVASLPLIQIVQGTPVSTDIRGVRFDTAEYSHPPVVASKVINGKNPIVFTGKATKVGLRSAFLVGDVAAQTDAVVPADLTYYQMHLQFESSRRDWEFSHRNHDQISVDFTTPNYTATPSITDKTSHFLSNIAARLNMNSELFTYRPSQFIGRKPFVCFGVNLDGTASGGVAISGISAGTSITFMTRAGVNYTYTADAAFVATLTEAVAQASGSGVAALDTSSKLMPINLAAATGLGTTAVGAGIDALLVVALDEPLAFVTDRHKTIRIRLRLGLSENWGTLVARPEIVKPEEQEGQGRLWQLAYDQRAAHFRRSMQWIGNNIDFINVPDYIDPSLTYNAYIILHRDDMYVGDNYDQEHNHELIILVPSSNSTVTTSLNAILAPWLNSGTMEKLSTFATAPDLF